MLSIKEARSGLKQLELEQQAALAEIKSLLKSGEKPERIRELRGIVLKNRFSSGGLRERNRVLRDSAKTESSREQSVNW